MSPNEKYYREEAEEENEVMPMFHYRVRGGGQPERHYISYAPNEAQALGQVVQTVRNSGAEGIDLEGIEMVATFANTTVIQVGGDVSAA